MFKPNFLKSIIIASSIVPAFALAGAFEGYVTVPFYAFDGAIGDDRGVELDDAIGLSATAGYRFNNPFAIELSYAQAASGVKQADTDIDFESVSVNGLYHFAESDEVSPYVLLGVANDQFTREPGGSNADIDDTAVDVALGLKGHITDLFELRTEIRNSHTIDEGYNIASLSIGFGLHFGGAKAAPAPAPVAAAPAAPLDSDNDGVTDDLDKCPGTAAKLKVDEVGCPIILKETVSISLNVLFDTASDVVKPEYESEARKVADFLEQYQGTTAVIEGHTDTRGSNAFNKTLSQKRADSVAKVLVSKFGVAPTRVIAKGYGEEQPLVTKDVTAGDQAKNRRVIAKLSAEKQTQVTK